MKIILLIPFLLIGLKGFAGSKKINDGYWHTAFELNESTILPVTFVFDKKDKKPELFILNADEIIELTDFQQRKDSIFITFPAFDSELKCKILDKKNIVGAWFNRAKGPDYKIPFTSKNAEIPRFKKNGSAINIYGKWEVTFDYDSHPEKALGIFDSVQYCSYNKEDLIKGTFLTEMGDYRYLEGVVSNDSLYLSTFDGSHAFLFESKLKDDTLWGTFLSGTHYQSKWYAVRNENFELTNPDSLTYLINDKPLELALPGLNNEIYTYPNKATKDKVTLIQIMGSWCPNCLDESRYLAQQKAYFNDNIEIIAVAFETQKTLEGKIEKVQNYKNNLKLDYTFLIGGKASKTEAKELFPMLNKIISFPTLIFIDKSGKIRKIHTGFNGPGTGDYYKHFVEKSTMFLEELIKE